METTMAKASGINYDHSKLDLLNTLESHLKICHDALDYYELKYPAKDDNTKIQTDIMDQKLIQLEADFLLELNFNENELNEYATLNAKLIGSLLFGNGLFSRDNTVYKPVLSDLANLIKKIYPHKNSTSHKFKDAWNSNNFGFTIEELFAFDKNKKSGANLKYVHANLIRYFIKRRIASINTIEFDIWFDDNLVDDTRNDYCVDYSVEITRSIETAYYNIKANQNPIGKSGPQDLGETAGDEKSKYENFSELRAELHEIDTELKKISRNLVNDDAAKEQYIKSYSDLMNQKEAYQFMLKKKAEELSYIQSGYTFVKDNIYENKSMAKKAAAKVILTTAGVRLGKSIYNELAGKGEKNDWALTGQQLAYDLAEAATAGIASLLLGPIGGTISSSFIGFLRPETPKPDPHMDKMIEIHKAINEGFDELSLKIDALEKKISEDINNMGKLIIENVKVNTLLIDFKKDLKEIHGYLNKIEVDYSKLSRPNNSINEKQFLDLNSEIEKVFNKILVSLFNNKAALNLDHNGNGLKIMPDSIIYEIMSVYAQKSESSKNFYEVCDILCPLLDSVQFVAQEYLKVRPHYNYVLSAITFFYDTSNNFAVKNEIQAKLLESHSSELETKLDFFSCFFLIHQNVIGENNYAFYQLMQEYWLNLNKINIQHGFALVEDNEKSVGEKQYNFNFPNDVYEANGTFKLVDTDKNHVNRYYLMPHHFMIGHQVKNDALYTFQNNEIGLPIDVKFGLWPNDTVKIITKSEELIARLVGTNHKVFAGSIEHALRQTNKKLDLQDLSLSLVKRNHWLKTIVNKDEKPELQIQKIENGVNIGIPKILSNFENLSQASVNAEEVAKALYGQFKITGEFCYLNAIESSKTENFFLENASQKLEEANLKESSVCILESENGRYTVKHCFFNFEGKYYDTNRKEFLINKEVRTFLFDGEKLMGSVFKNYNNNFNATATKLIMQDDGNFVLYDSDEKALAATGTDNKPKNTFLHLTNEGKLVLISNQTKKITTTIDITNTENNRLNKDEQINLGDSKISANGRYKLKFCELMRPDKKKMNLLLSNGLNFKKVFTSDYLGYQDDYTRNYVRLDNNNLLLTSWRHHKRAFMSDEIYTTDERAIKFTKEIANAYLEISDDGKLNVCIDKNIIETIFDFNA